MDINLNNDKLDNSLSISNGKLLDGNDKLDNNLSISDGKLLGGKLNCFSDRKLLGGNDKLDNNLSIRDGKLFGGKLNCSSTSFNDKLHNNLNISLVNRKLEPNKELKETELETKCGLSINNNNIPNSRLILINNVKPLASTVSSSPCLKPLHVSNSNFHLNHSDHGNIIIKHCKSRKSNSRKSKHCDSRKRQELEDNINNKIIKCDLNVKTGSSTTT